MKKERYHHRLPHFHTPGQNFFITWCLQSAIPIHAIEGYSQQLEALNLKIEHATQRNQDQSSLQDLKKEYDQIKKKYLKTFNDLIDFQKHPKVDLSTPEYTKIMMNALWYWEKEKLTNIAFSVMPNHVHWVVAVNSVDSDNNEVYLQDILFSVKKYTATKINKLENRRGRLWQKESFDTTIRDEQHLQKAIIYTLNNPVKANLCSYWDKWPGNWCHQDYLDILSE